MPTQKRDLPPQNVHRFNYWEFFRPGGLKTIAPIKQHIQHQFNLLRNASPADALKYYVEDDKEWVHDPEAWKVFRQLSQSEQDQMWELYRKRWKYLSQWTWDTLLKAIANDQELFLRYCDRSLTDQESSAATNRRVLEHYSKQAIKLLGGGTYISPARRNAYRDILDDSDDPKTLLISGRLPCPSIIEGVDWLTCTSNDERRQAKKLTLHWFHHALRNLREYRNGHRPIPWAHDCAESCCNIREKLLKA